MRGNETAVLRIAEIKERLDHLDARQARAKQRLANSPNGYCFLAIVGVEFNGLSLGMEPLAHFQHVVEPPGEVELARASKDRAIFGAVGRYSSGIKFELAVQDEGNRLQPGLKLGWSIVSALRVRTCAEFVVVAASDHSWSTIAAIDNQTCHIQLLEDYPRAHRFASIGAIQDQDLRWVGNHLIKFIDLLDSAAFRLAVDCICSYNHMASKRMSAAMLWSGVEALFFIAAELRFRLAASIAASLEDRGPARINCYKRVKKLYDFRSRLVHGSAATETAISNHVIEVRKLLSLLLCRCTESGNIFDDATIEQLLLG